jgi:peptidoglycan-associated lipoprotein
MNPVHRRIAGSAVSIMAAISIAACASHPKPTPVATEAPPKAPPAYTPPPYTPPPPTASAQLGPVPGSVQDFVVHAGDRIYFDFDKYTLRADADSTLGAQASWLERYPQVMVRIEGNTDDRGTREYNFALGARRASSVKDYLVSHGVSPSRIETVSYGKEHPIALGGTEDDYAKNRNAHTDITSGARPS